MCFTVPNCDVIGEEKGVEKGGGGLAKSRITPRQKFFQVPRTFFESHSPECDIIWGGDLDGRKDMKHVTYL